MELSHAEMEKEHYKLVHSDTPEGIAYRMEGVMDVLREEMSMTMPFSLEDRSEIGSHAPKPEQTPKQWDIVNQLKAEVVGWRQKHAELQSKVDKLSSKRKKKYD